MPYPGEKPHTFVQVAAGVRHPEYCGDTATHPVHNTTTAVLPHARQPTSRRREATSMTTEPRTSPWGPVQHAHAIGSAGIWQVSTAGHGGIKVPAALNEKINPAWRNTDGWYEEDT